MLRKIKSNKIILLILMAVTIAMPSLLYLTSRYGANPDLANKMLSIFGFTAMMVLLWQYLLGIRFIVARMIPDLVWVNKLHQYMGIYGSLVLFAHPVILFASRGLMRYLPSATNLASPGFNFIFFGQLAFFVVLMTWLGSAIFRRHLPYRTWKRFHLINYVALPLALMHIINLSVGMAFVPALQMYVWVVAGIYILALSVRLLAQLTGFYKNKAELISIESLTHDVKKLTFKVSAGSKLLNALPGQFLYLQVNKFGENHPFTIALLDTSTHTLSIMPKDSGPFSKYIHTLTPGTEVLLDGPYGIFTTELNTEREANRKPVFIAGGIGITPFVTHIENAAKNKKQFRLFYANKTESDIVLYEQFKQYAANFESVFVPVNDQQSDFAGEQGWVNVDLLKKYLGEILTVYDFYVCGPIGMIKAITKELKAAGIPDEQIFSEKFSL